MLPDCKASMAGSRGGDTGAATPAADPEAVGRVFGEEEGWCRDSRVTGGVYGEGLLTTLFVSLESTCPTKVSSLVSRAASPADGDPGG